MIRQTRPESQQHVTNQGGLPFPSRYSFGGIIPGIIPEATKWDTFLLGKDCLFLQTSKHQQKPNKATDK